MSEPKLTEAQINDLRMVASLIASGARSRKSSPACGAAAEQTARADAWDAGAAYAHGDDPMPHDFMANPYRSTPWRAGSTRSVPPSSGCWTLATSGATMPDADQTPATDRVPNAIMAGSTAAIDRVTALTLRIGDLCEQRDQARADAAAWPVAFGEVCKQRDEARAQVQQLMACQTAADDLRHRIEALAIALEEAEIADMIDHHSGDVAALLGPDSAGSAHRAANSASVDPPDADDLRATVAELHQPTDADECPVCTTEDGMSYASPCPTLRAVRALGGAGTAHRVETGAGSATPDLLGPQIGAESLEDDDR